MPCCLQVVASCHATSTHEFLLAHHHHQPSLPVIDLIKREGRVFDHHLLYILPIVLVPPVASSASRPSSGIPIPAPTTTTTTLWSMLPVMASSWSPSVTVDILTSAILLPANVLPYRCFVIMNMAYQLQEFALLVSTNILHQRIPGAVLYLD